MNLFDPKNPRALWGKIADVQEEERQHELRKAQEQQAKPAARSSGGFSAGVKHRLPPGEVRRATDFWREALKDSVRADIKRNNAQKLSIYASNYAKIQKAKQEQKLPADFFVDVTGWLWSVKEDGYLVKLIREDNKWSMRTRKDTFLNPPPAFLQGLEKNKELPSFMVGELVTDFTGCDEDSRKDEKRRNKERNKQFGKLIRVFKGREDVWDGLRVKIFSFPHSSMDMKDQHSSRSMQETYEHYSNVMQRTLQYHPHIGMCRFGTLKSTQHAIDIFNSVVQMGLEGIVIVKADVQYGALTYPHTGDNAENKLFFKLKQKIVLAGRQITNLGTIQRSKDGELETPEYEYRITDDNDSMINMIKFIDQQNRETDTFSRLKFMEFVPGDGQDKGFDRFPCIEGYRHMHFANKDDESVKVPALWKFKLDQDVRDVLGWDNNSNRILNWDKIQDNTKLKESSTLIQLFNPRPFAFKSALLCEYPSAPPSPPARPLRHRSHARVKINQQEDDTKHQTPYDVARTMPMKADNSDSDPVLSPKPNSKDPIEVQPGSKDGPQPLENESFLMKRAWYQMLRDDAQIEARRKARQEEAEKNLQDTARNMYYIISSFGNI